MKQKDPTYTDEEIARRRDEVIRRMAKTPPQHKETKPKKRTKPKPARSRSPRTAG